MTNILPNDGFLVLILRNCRFSSEVELGKFLGSINIISDAYGAISKTTSTYELHTSPSGIQILAFNCPTDYTTRFLNGEFCLVSSENHKVIDFISTGRKDKFSFSINKAAVELFEHLPDDLKCLQKKVYTLSYYILETKIKRSKSS